ncbi:MAG: hypothetical protein HRT88_09180, partial [Lentisphaeraceae bacterium]|nr:hypothetical protein [Lentisphaeraceae bacterium]
FYIPQNLRNKFTLKLAETKQKLTAPNAVYLHEVNELFTALLSVTRLASFSWKPIQEKMSQAEPLYFAETSSLIVAGDGLVAIQHHLNIQITRGQISQLVIDIPKNQNVTAVNAASLLNWAFDARKNTLELLFEKEIQDNTQVQVSTQISTDKLPYEQQVAMIHIQGAERQRGLLAVSSSAGIQLHMKKTENLQSIAANDFNSAQFAINKKRAPQALIFPYRYFQADANLSLKTSKILPKISVEDRSNFSIGDERFILNSRLLVEVKKAGVFQLKLRLPQDYDIESLSAAGSSHWEEINDKTGKYAILFFNRRLKGRVQVNCVLAKNSERKSAKLQVPGISIIDEKKHRGSIIISAERGNRLEIATKSGIGGTVLVNEGSMTFTLLKNDWSMTLQREVLQPRIEAEYLQAVEFSENLYQTHIKLHIKIENAGTKSLILQAPEKLENLEILGTDIAKTEKLEKGRWRLEFKRKVFGEYRLNIRYQSYMDLSSQIKLSVFAIVGAQKQQGYLSINIPSYMSSKIAFNEGSIQQIEARLLPTKLAGEKQRKATHAYRILNSTWDCALDFIRHTNAEVLEASVSKVDIKSMVARDGRQLHIVTLNISGGTKNFLKMQLPENSQLCSVFSSGEALEISRQQEFYHIPLNQSLPGSSTRRLQILYIQDKKEFSWSKAQFEGPRFDLPLREINWKLYVPKEGDYRQFSGTMDYQPRQLFFRNSTDSYLSKQKNSDQLSRENANSLLVKAYKLSSSGRRDLARKTFESVVNLSENMNDIQEDARVQLQNTLRQQTLVGLVKRRKSLKANISGAQHDFDDKRYRDGYFSNSFAAAVRETLAEDDQQILARISDKILNQQKSAIKRLMPLLVSFPAEGRQLHFYREVLVDSMSPLTVNFSSAQKPVKVEGLMNERMRSVSVVMIVLLICGLLFGVKFRRCS